LERLERSSLLIALLNCHQEATFGKPLKNIKLRRQSEG
jgi:hypothetical protein